MRLPDPIMLTAAAMIKSNDDLAVDPDPERGNIALKAIRGWALVADRMQR